MKRNYILLLLITIVTFTSCDKEWSEINELDINGKVKKLTTFYYKIKNDSIGNTYNDTIKIDIYILNRKGQLVDRNTKVFSNNKFRYSILTKFKYNFKGQLIKEIYNMPKDFENIGDFEDFETFFTYKDSLQISSKTNYTLEELLFHINEEFSYDSNGNLSYSEERNISIDSKTKDTVSFQRYFYKYDKKGALVELKWTDSENKLTNSYEKFENDKNGLRLKDKSYNLKDELLDSTVYKYKFDDRNNWIKKEGFKNKELFDVTERIIE